MWQILNWIIFVYSHIIIIHNSVWSKARILKMIFILLDPNVRIIWAPSIWIYHWTISKLTCILSWAYLSHLIHAPLWCLIIGINLLRIILSSNKILLNFFKFYLILFNMQIYIFWTLFLNFIWSSVILRIYIYISLSILIILYARVLCDLTREVISIILRLL